MSKKLCFRLFLALGTLLSLAAVLCWWTLIRPYVWIDSGRVKAVLLSVQAPEEGVLTRLSVSPGSVIEKGSFLFTLENPKIADEQKKIEKSLIALRKELQFYKSQSEEAMQNYLSDLGVRSQPEVDQHLQMLQNSQVKTAQLQEQLQDLLGKEKAFGTQKTKLSAASPCQGIFLKQEKRVGDALQPGEPILTLLDLNQCWIEAEAPEKILHLLQVGQPVDIYLTAYPKQNWKGTISWIGPATLSQLGDARSSPGEEKVPLKISINQDHFPAKPGLSAKIRLRI